MITIDELLLERKALEDKIRAALNQLIKDFQDRTAIPVSGISLSMVDVTTMADERRRHILNRVEVSLELEKL